LLKEVAEEEEENKQSLSNKEEVIEVFKVDGTKEEEKAD
jgi:hypothetical protein